MYCPLLPPPRSTIAACFRPDGAVLASTHGDHTVKLIDASTGACVCTLSGHRRTPWVVRFHPNNPNVLASGSLDENVRVWDARTGDCMYSHDFRRAIASLAWHASGDVIAVAAGHRLYVWDGDVSKAPTGGTKMAAPVVVLHTKRSLRAVHFHPLGAPLLLTAEVNAAKTEQDPPASADWSRWGQTWTRGGEGSGSGAAHAHAHAQQAPSAAAAAAASAAAAAVRQPEVAGRMDARGVMQAAVAGQMLQQQGGVGTAAEGDGSGGVGGSQSPAVSMDVDGDAGGDMRSDAEHGGAGSLNSVYEAMSAAAMAAERYTDIDQTLSGPERQALIAAAAAAAAAQAAHSEGGGDGDQPMPDSTTHGGGSQQQGFTASAAGTAAPSDGGDASPSMWEAPPDLTLLQTVGGEASAATAAAAAAASTAAAAVAAAATAKETPCTVMLKLWPFDKDRPTRNLNGVSPRLTIPHAVLCSEMGAHLSPCGHYMAACVACRAPEAEAARPDAAMGDAPLQAGVVYELRIYSLREASFGQVLAARPVRAAHCLTSIQFSPTSKHVLLAYGRRHISLLRSLVAHRGSIMPVHTILEVYRVSDMSLVRMLPSAEDEVNVATFHPRCGGGLVYGTKEGRLRILQHGRLPPGAKAEGNAGQANALEDSLIGS